MERDVFVRRRQRVLERLGGGVLVVPAAPVYRRNGDVEHVYRQESDLLYLTGFSEPESVLVLNPAAEKPYTLFVRPRDRDAEIWNGRRAGVEGAVAEFGADQAFTIDQLDKELPRLLAGAQTLHYSLGIDADTDRRIIGHLSNMRRRARLLGPPPERIADPGPLLHELRLLKDDAEVAVLRRAAELTTRGHLRAMAATRPGMHEYEVEAELLYEYRRGGGTGPGYENIVAAGVNATILHYRAGDAVLHDGDLVLIDSGCEVDGYTADVTRTFPVNGRFTRPQQALYEIVLDAHFRALEAVRPGTTLDAIHELATRTLIEGLLREKLLEGTVDSCWEDKSFRRFYMHRTSHWLGMDVHDVGAYSMGGAPRPLAAGMVLTVEPGLYVSADDDKVPEEYRGIGIRVEDDVLVTPSGSEVLTAAVPRTVEELRRAQGVK